VKHGFIRQNSREAFRQILQDLTELTGLACRLIEGQTNSFRQNGASVTLTTTQREELTVAIAEAFAPEELARVVTKDLGLKIPNSIFPETFDRFVGEVIERCERLDSTPRLIFVLCHAKPKLLDFLPSVVHCS
jgi:hypothetical protein